MTAQADVPYNGFAHAFAGQDGVDEGVHDPSLPLLAHDHLVLTADDRIFRLPLGYSERLHERIGVELAKAAPGGEGYGPG